MKKYFSVMFGLHKPIMANTSSIEIDNINTTPVDVNFETPEVVSTANISLEADTGENSSPTTPVVPFVFDASYKGDARTQRVAEILGLPGIQGWTITDVDDNLAMVHYTDDADTVLYGHLRGILVDLEKGAIVATSFGHTPTAVASELVETNGVITVKDTTGDLHTFETANSSIKRVFEGVVIRVARHKGRSKRMTHRKINAQRSHWGSSPTFLSMYEEAGGPTDEQLFDLRYPYSSTVYVFMIRDKSLSVGARQKITRPCAVYLARYEMDLKRPEEEVAPGIANFTTSPLIGGEVNESFIHEPKSLTIEEANNHLKYGYYNAFDPADERQLTGEAVILYRMENGAVADIVKVHSPSYDWRVNLRGNDPNVRHRFYTLLNTVYPDIETDEQWNTLTESLIPFPLYDEQSIKELYNSNQGILTIPPGPVSRDNYATRDSRIHLLWMNYLLSLPANVQAGALDLLSKFHEDRNNLITWLQSLEMKHKDVEQSDLPPRVKGLISSSRRLARDRVKKGNNYSARGNHMKLPLLIKSTLRNLVCKENGPSLFGLVRDMKEAHKPKQETPVHPVAVVAGAMHEVLKNMNN
ncbi:3 phosphatase [uncultured virus]|nr:3 phosphatase [uncultured virus]